MLNLRHATVDLKTGRVRRTDGGTPSLTSIELALLIHLSENAGAPQERDHLLTEVWGYKPGISSRALDTAIKTLRRKVEASAATPDHIHTVRGVGYRFEAIEPLVDPDFVGRRALLQVLELALGTHDLVTLIGMGGVGKSRLAGAARFTGRICPVDLAGATTAQAVEAAVSAAVGGPGPLDERLRQQAPLLVLDNLEQVAAQAGPLCQRWVGIHGVRILSTSRVALNVPEEHRISVEPLTLQESIELFQRRAALGAPHLASMVPSVFEDLAKALGGLPLALELAAGRAAILSPTEIVERLSTLDLLRSPSRESIEESMARSWSMLTKDDQQILCWCSLFVSRFRTADVEAISRVWAVDGLQRLVATHLIRHEPQGLALHPLVRTFVRPKAVQRLPDPWNRHAAYVTSQAGSTQAAVHWLPELAAILERDVDPAHAARAGISAARAYAHLSVYAGRKRAVARALVAASETGEGPLLVEATNVSTRLRLAMGLTTESEVDDVVHLARQHPESELAVALLNQGIHHRLSGTLERALACFNEACAVASGSTLAHALSERGVVQRAQGHLTQAVGSLREALVVCSSLDSSPEMPRHLHRLGSALIALNQRIEGKELLKRSEDLHLVAGFLPGAMAARGSIAEVLLDEGDPDLANAHLAPCLAWVNEHGVPDIQLIMRSLQLKIDLDREDYDAARNGLSQAMLLKASRKMDPSILAQLDLLGALIMTQRDSGFDVRSAWDRAVESALADGRPKTKVYAVGYRAGLFAAPDDFTLLESLASPLEQLLPVAFAAAVRGQPSLEGLTGFHLRMWSRLSGRPGK